MGANPNTMTFKTVFSAEYQMSHYKEPVYQVIADTRLEPSLTKGQTIARSYASDVSVNDMGADGSYSTQAITDTQETLVINDEKEASIYIKKLDELQAHLPLKQKYGRKLANALINQIDGDVLLSAYQGAGTTLDDGDFSGTDGNGLAVTASNVATVFTTAMQKLRLKNTIYNKRFRPASGMKLEVPEGMPTAVISPEILSYIELYLGGKDTLLGDQISRNGYAGYFHGFECFSSNALPWTGTLALATNPTDGDTITINGVTITFQTSLTTATGSTEVHIASTVDITRANLVEFLNSAGADSETEDTDTGYSSATASEQKLLKNMTWTNDNSADTATVVASGWGTVVVSETLTDATDTWTTTKQQLHNLFTAGKCVSLVIQKNPSLEDNPVSGKIGRDYIAWTAYGRKVFKDQQPMIVQLAVDSSAFTSAATVVN